VTHRGSGIQVGVLAVAAAIAVTFFALAVQRYENRDETAAAIRQSGIPPSISTLVANMMALSPVPSRPAPGFTLVDQNGKRISLSSFRGRAVVIEFTDPHCTDVCPIISQEMVDATAIWGRWQQRRRFSCR